MTNTTDGTERAEDVRVDRVMPVVDPRYQITPPRISKAIVTLDRVCFELGLNPRTTHRRLNAGECDVPMSLVDGQWRIAREDLDAYTARKRAEAHARAEGVSS